MMLNNIDAAKDAFKKGLDYDPGNLQFVEVRA